MVNKFTAIDITKETFNLYGQTYKKISLFSSIFALYLTFFLMLDESGAVFNTLYIFNGLVAYPLFYSVIYIFHSRFNQGRKITILKSISLSFQKFWNLLWGNLIATIILVFGTIFLIIPGLYFFPKLYFMSTAIAIDNYNISQSIENSWNMTKGNFWLIYRSFLLMILITLFPFIFMIFISEYFGILTYLTTFVAVLLGNAFIIQNALMYDRLKS